jgi:hypothetical protein
MLTWMLILQKNLYGWIFAVFDYPYASNTFVSLLIKPCSRPSPTLKSLITL